MNNQEQEIRKKVFKYNQGHVFEFWNKLSKRERTNLINDLSDIDFEQLNELVDQHIKNKKSEKKIIEPAPVTSIPAKKKERRKRNRALKIGRKAIQKGEVAVFLVAGGQGSRLGYNGPKGCFRISPIKKKSLFQLQAEKILAIQKKYNTAIQWYIMTSKTNDSRTRNYFKRNNYFNLDPENIMFFQQKEIPAVDMKGKLILETKNKIFKNPNGHGGSILALHESGALKDMKKRGIKYIFYYQVDNALIKILDPVFTGYHILENAKMSSKIVKKAYPEERVGVIGYVNKKLGVIEYSDLSKTDMYAKNPDDTLKYNAGNIAIHIINRRFVKKLNKKKLPFHKAVKNIPTFNRNVKGMKFETFVFDALAHARHSVTMEVKREDEFAPLKNKDGTDSPTTAAEMQIDMHARWLEYCKINVPKDDKLKIEISPLFALDPNELKKKIPAGVEFRSNISL
ncbi:UDPGP type 1 family protein [Candidatus Woesearchaeota archaeon]|nr:UDPGP type 1 family protein [Candidatus Woesearchaeota archaeon]